MAKILIIDDEEQLRRLMARIIGLEGYEVAEAPDCASGMKTLRRYDPDVVLCDVKLPDGNGVEMVGRIKGGRAGHRSDPADGLRQYPRRRAGHQERRLRLHHQRRRQQQDPAPAEPGRRKGRNAAAADPHREQALRRALLRPDRRRLGGPAPGRGPGPQGRRHRHFGAAHRRDGNRQGGLRASHPPRQPPGEGGFRGDQLLGFLARTARKRTVRPPGPAVSRAPPRTRRAFSKRPTKARYSSTRSGRCPSNCRPNCSACSKAANSSRSAKHAPHGLTCA